jgi:dCMP deaminase
MRTFVAYVPVLHEGYRKFFESHEGPKELYIFGPDITSEFPQLAKEIRQLDPDLMRGAIESIGVFEHVSLLDIAGAQAFNSTGREIILPDEDVSRAIATKYFPKAQATFDPIFLRWDKHNAQKERELVPDARVSREEFDKKVMAMLEQEAAKSGDTWRHVAAAIVKEGKVVLMRHNTHLPSEHSPYAHGDPRSNYHRGDHMELSTALHAEAGLIAEAAGNGLALKGADMYVTVYPCPPCAKLIAFAGIKNLYVAGGNPILDAQEVMKSRGVSIIFVA